MTTDLKISMPRRLAAEAIGTGLLIVAVIGSGVMAERLTDIVALQLLCNAVATGGALVALILIFAPVSGASFNPVVGISADFARRQFFYLFGRSVDLINGLAG